MTPLPRALLAMLLLGCRREPPVRADPVVVDAAPKPAPTKLGDARVLRRGSVIDLREGRVVAVLSKEATTLEDQSDGRGYFVDRVGVLHAIDLATAAELWSAKVPGRPLSLVASPRGVVVSELSAITVYDRGGAFTTSKFIGDVSHLVRRRDEVWFLELHAHLHRVDFATRTATSVAKLPFDVNGWDSALRAWPGGAVCGIASPMGVLEVACVDDGGKIAVRRTLDLRRPSDPKGVSYAVRAVTDRHVVFGVGPFFLSGVRRAGVVRLSDGAVVATVEDDVATVVEREDGALEGLLVVEPELRLVETSGKVRWKVASPAPHDESASALARDGRIVVDVYPAISSGSTLVALDAATGALRWKGDVEMLPIGHSEYFNHVELSSFEDRVVLRGDEASLTTFQLFAAGDGKRVLAVSQLLP